jgi:hypothetical protein
MPIVNIIAILLGLTYLVMAVYYLVKPVGPLGHNCTFDYFDCESNINLLGAVGNFFLALITGLVYVAVRVIYRLVHKHIKG